MIEIFGIKLTTEAAAFFLLFLFDEIIPYLPVKGNNILQFASGVIKALKPHRKEDEVISSIKQELAQLRGEIVEVKKRRTPTRRPYTRERGR